MALEEPQFDVVRRADDYEIRLYASHLVAEVDVYGDHEEAGNPAFGILAGYIFGDNGSAEKMAMTSRIMAVRQYSGRWTEAKYKKNERALMQSLQADGVTVTQVSATVPCFL